MTPKILSFTIMVLACSFTYGQSKGKTKFINPTGSYKLNSRTEIRDGETFGYFGEIKVKALDSSKIIVSLYVCKGAPSYNSGSFIDTISYNKNTAIHTTPDSDSTCVIKLVFNNKGLTIEQHQTNLNFGCEFGHGVFADGFYRRISQRMPSSEELESLYDGNIGARLWKIKFDETAHNMVIGKSGLPTLKRGIK